ncbi:MAG: DHHA1 domain-containing protein [Clostridiales bacterium]|nr:MAG: DHHA1 domain-containing protein [Clostridiales bacterium]
MCENSFCIDHHVTNKGFADFNYIDADASATGEIVFALAKALDVKNRQKNCAKYLYCAVASDTGSFKYSNTSEKTFEIAGALRKIYGEFSNLSHAMFDEFTVEQLRLKQHVLESLKLYHGGKKPRLCALITNILKTVSRLTTRIFLTSIPRSVKGVEVGIFAKIKRDEIKFSLRSNEFVNVSEIAAKFGGGGHKRASGVSFKIPYDEAVEKLLKAIENEIR